MTTRSAASWRQQNDSESDGETKTGEQPMKVKTQTQRILCYIQDPKNFIGDFFDTIARWTNKHAEMYFADSFDELSARERRWRDTNGDELKKFLGLNFLMGALQKSKISD